MTTLIVASVAIAAAAAGCAQIFGLDETHSGTGDPIDGSVDGPAAPDARTGVCSPVLQDGCDSPNVCDIDYAAGGPAYCRLGNTRPALSPCAQNEDCGGGTTCVGGACRSFCDASHPCTGSENDCHLDDYSAQICDTVCDLRAPDTGGCPSGMHCALTISPSNPDQFGAFCNPGSGGTLGIGAECSSNPEGCRNGALCLSTDGTSFTCLQLCYTDLASNCTAPQQCLPLGSQTAQAEFHGHSLGACAQ
ncbi:MAG: hypothetical protein H6709_21815 [Kofleriaceae bacterium]|nr:hypothetical protein [Kofleriaceae bacterium]MCB9574722.1 hypothetical protein [Kofleriaceae bacterium]